MDCSLPKARRRKFVIILKLLRRIWERRFLLMLSVKDIDVYYGNIHALKGLSLEVNEGEIVTLIGANGAGKTTLLKTLSGLLKPKSGTIEYLSGSISGKPAQTIVKAG